VAPALAAAANGVEVRLLERMTLRSSTVYPRSCAIWMIVSRVIPGRIEAARSGVAILSP
jgi:hypothetical protein